MQPDSFRHAMGEAHRRYTRHVNFREKWRGHLWQERFASYPMGVNHLLAAARYIERNPVRAGLAREPWLYNRDFTVEKSLRRFPKSRARNPAFL